MNRAANHPVIQSHDRKDSGKKKERDTNGDDPVGEISSLADLKSSKDGQIDVSSVVVVRSRLNRKMAKGRRKGRSGSNPRIIAKESELEKRADPGR